jgi:hypothetical protein
VEQTEQQMTSPMTGKSQLSLGLVALYRALGSQKKYINIM